MAKMPTRSTSKLNYEQYINLLRDVSRLKNLHFDPLVFSVLADMTGTYVSTRSQVVATVKSSFGFCGFYTLDGCQYMRLYGGTVRYQGRESLTIADTIDDPLTHVQITGSLVSPTWVCIKMDTDTHLVSLCESATEPVDSGSVWYRPLHTAYLTDEGTPVYLMDKRPDWVMGSPIG